MKIPPREMCDSKLNCLRVIQSWLFCDGIITLRRSYVNLNDGPYTLKLKGHTIRDSHLNQILEKERHIFSLQEQGYKIYNGKFKPVDMIGGGVLEPVAFEKRLLSLSIEKSCGIIICRIGLEIYAYFSAARQDLSGKLIGLEFSFEGEIFAKSYEQSAGRYDMDSKTSSFTKYSLVTNLKNAKRVLKDFRVCLRQHSSALNENILIVEVAKDDGGPINIYTCGNSNSFEIGKPDLARLLRTPDVTLHKSNNSSASQILKFNQEEINSSLSPHIDQNLPEGVRLLQAIADGRYRDPAIRFVKSESANNDQFERDAETEYIEIRLDSKLSRNKWNWTKTHGSAMLNFDSIPATTAPQSYDMYACCGNILELKGGRIRAEGITILPGGDDFISLSRRCLGIDPISHDKSNNIPDKHCSAADTFYDFFAEIIAKELDYSPQAVTLLCSVFHSLNGLEMKQWDHEKITNLNNSKHGHNPVPGGNATPSLTSRLTPTSSPILTPTEAKSDKGKKKKKNKRKKEKKSKEEGSKPDKGKRILSNEKTIPAKKNNVTQKVDSSVISISSDLSMEEQFFSIAEIYEEFGVNNLPNSFISMFNDLEIMDDDIHNDSKHQPKTAKTPATIKTKKTKKGARKKPNKLYVCPKCDLLDNNPLSLRDLRKHICLSHFGFDINNQKTPESCVACKKKKLTKDTVWTHFIDAHTDFKLQPS